MTNDDGPPNQHSSPYIATFVKILRSPPFSHKVSVVLPSTQRSWIGKAHLLPASLYPLAGQQPKAKNEDIEDVITPTYYNPSSGEVLDALPHSNASVKGNINSVDLEEDDYWVLIPGTPATCVQLGLFHHNLLFPPLSALSNYPPQSTSTTTNTPIDLIISGPNHGRNTTAAFALSSGTLGGALEGAVCGVRAIALSFAFFTRQESDEIIDEACAHSARIVERLWKEWETQNMENVPDLYTINVPLVAGIAREPVRWTWILDNKWNSGSLYKTIEVGTDKQSEVSQAGPPSFKWGPTFGDIWKTVEQSRSGNDGLTIREGCTSVTPMMANYHVLHGQGGFQGDLKL